MIILEFETKILLPRGQIFCSRLANLPRFPIFEPRVTRDIFWLQVPNFSMLRYDDQIASTLQSLFFFNSDRTRQR